MLLLLLLLFFWKWSVMPDNDVCISLLGWWSAALSVVVESDIRTTILYAVLTFEGRICWGLRCSSVSLLLIAVIFSFFPYLHTRCVNFSRRYGSIQWLPRMMCQYCRSSYPITEMIQIVMLVFLQVLYEKIAHLTVCPLTLDNLTWMMVGCQTDI